MLELLTILGPVVTLVVGYIFGRRRRLENIDYKQRWLDAVRLLGDEGKLSTIQVRSVSNGEHIITDQARATSSALRATQRISQPTVNMDFSDMTSWDRKAVEIDRAKNGVPPIDDLSGMTSWDRKAVLLARSEAETRPDMEETREVWESPIDPVANNHRNF